MTNFVFFVLEIEPACRVTILRIVKNFKQRLGNIPDTLFHPCTKEECMPARTFIGEVASIRGGTGIQHQDRQRGRKVRREQGGVRPGGNEDEPVIFT